MPSILHSLRNMLLLAAVALVAAAAPVAAQGETIEYYGSDAGGSVRIVFNASGTVLGRQDYDPFGREILSAWGVVSERFGGESADTETDQAYFHARQFQSRTARFTAVDPVFDGLTEPQRWNRYAYALNNPVRFTDASGLEAAGGCPDEHLPDGTIVHIDECDSSVAGGDSGGTGIWDAAEWLFLHTIDTFAGTEPLDSAEIAPTSPVYTPSHTLQTIATVIELAAVVAPLGKAASAEKAGSVASKAVTKVGKTVAGEFSVWNWKGYPEGVPRPDGPFRVLTGQEYSSARSAANRANRMIRQADPAAYVGMEIHEVQPVKFGGSPTDVTNKMSLTEEIHDTVSGWWFSLQSYLGGGDD
jgi:RHS repeat-associated protein